MTGRVRRKGGAARAADFISIEYDAFGKAIIAFRRDLARI
jgi:hypothetical protein